MGLGGEVLAVVGQAGQQLVRCRAVVADREPGRVQLGAQPLVVGQVGALLADPFGLVLQRPAPAGHGQQPVHRIGVVVDYVDRTNRIFSSKWDGLMGLLFGACLWSSAVGLCAGVRGRRGSSRSVGSCRMRRWVAWWLDFAVPAAFLCVGDQFLAAEAGA